MTPHTGTSVTLLRDLIPEVQYNVRLGDGDLARVIVAGVFL